MTRRKLWAKWLQKLLTVEGGAHYLEPWISCGHYFVMVYVHAFTVSFKRLSQRGTTCTLNVGELGYWAILITCSVDMYVTNDGDAMFVATKLLTNAYNVATFTSWQMFGSHGDFVAFILVLFIQQPFNFLINYMYKSSILWIMFIIT